MMYAMLMAGWLNGESIQEYRVYDNALQCQSDIMNQTRKFNSIGGRVDIISCAKVDFTGSQVWKAGPDGSLTLIKTK